MLGFYTDAQPTERELPVYSQVKEVLQYANAILYELQQYKGASNEIREVSVFFVFWMLHTFYLGWKVEPTEQIMQLVHKLDPVK